MAEWTDSQTDSKENERKVCFLFYEKYLAAKLTDQGIWNSNVS